MPGKPKTKPAGETCIWEKDTHTSPLIMHKSLLQQIYNSTVLADRSYNGIYISTEWQQVLFRSNKTKYPVLLEKTQILGGFFWKKGKCKYFLYFYEHWSSIFIKKSKTPFLKRVGTKFVFI